MAVSKYSALHTNSSIVMYADDLTLLHCLRSAEEDSLQSEYDNIVSWSNSIGLPINYSKCAVMNVITRKNLSVEPIKTSSGDILKTASSIKILGVHFCDNLKWNIHITKTVCHASQRLFVLANLRRFGCPSHLIRRTYFAFVRSILLYCCPVFINAPKYLTDKIVRIEKRAAKMIGEQIHPDVLSTMNRSCESLFQKIVIDDNHPLQECFNSRTRCSRSICPLRKPFARTLRYKSSFIKFCK